MHPHGLRFKCTGLSKARCLYKQEFNSPVGKEKSPSVKSHSKNVYTLGKAKCLRGRRVKGR